MLFTRLKRFTLAVFNDFYHLFPIARWQRTLVCTLLLSKICGFDTQNA
jgi:hypothetical protein